MKVPSSSIVTPILTANPCEGEKKYINLELWQACAGPLVNLPIPGTHVLYFPQGHSEQVAASMKKDMDAQIPNYPNLPSKLLCRLHNVTLHADPETDEVYAQMTLLPVPSFDKDALLRSDIAMKTSKPQADFFCKTLTASDTSTHGGFSVPRRAAEKIFPPLDFSMQPPAQELCAKDLHDNLWTFRHIYRGQPKRHLLTTGWSLFVSGKRLLAGDSVLFIRDEKQQLLLGIRRANRQPTNLSSSVLSSDSMHIGILAAAAHAAANNSPFTIFYNPRASPSEFVIPLAKYYKAVYSNQISLGMRFRMMFETEESGTRRYMGTITGINDIDPVRWKNSQWRNLQVGWDESSTGERRSRVSIWEIEPVTTPFFFCPPSFIRPKRPRQPGVSEAFEVENIFKRTVPWVGDDLPLKETQTIPGLNLVQWMNMQQNQPLSFNPPLQPTYLNSFPNTHIPAITGPDLSHHLPFSTPHLLQPVITNPALVPLPNVSPQQPDIQKAIHKCQPHFQLKDTRPQLQHSLFLPHSSTLQKPTLPEDAISPPKTAHQLSSAAGISGLTDEIPSCSTSPSMNNCSGAIHPVVERCRFGAGVVVGEETGQSCCVLSPGGIESVTANHIREKPGNVPNCPPHTLFPNISHLDNLDTSSSSATSGGAFSNTDFFSYRQQPQPPLLLSRGREADLSDMPRNDLFAERSLGIPNAPFGKMGPDQVDVGVHHFENTKDMHHQELSSSIASQSFGLPDLVFNSADSDCVNDDGFASHNQWGPPPHLPLLRTFTKVYKRGAVGRSIDISRYLGYEELRHDLARRFGLEGQLEEKQRMGWKLVYVDHENDVLLVGDDPWEEFVNCVRCIRILSPQEVQQMSLDGDFGGGILPNQACSSSEGGECFM